jgi:hypothetical protein
LVFLKAKKPKKATTNTLISLLDKLRRLKGREKAFYSKILHAKEKYCDSHAKEKYCDSPHGKI